MDDMLVVIVEIVGEPAPRPLAEFRRACFEHAQGLVIHVALYEQTLACPHDCGTSGKEAEPSAVV